MGRGSSGMSMAAIQQLSKDLSAAKRNETRLYNAYLSKSGAERGFDFSSWRRTHSENEVQARYEQMRKATNDAYWKYTDANAKRLKLEQKVEKIRNQRERALRASGAPGF